MSMVVRHSFGSLGCRLARTLSRGPWHDSISLTTQTPYTRLPVGAHVPASPTRARLSLVLLLYFLGVIGVITLAPFRFSMPKDVHVLASGDWFDVVANILLVRSARFSLSAHSAG